MNMKYAADEEMKSKKKPLLLHPKLSWQVVGGSGVGRVWWCGTGQWIRKEICGSVQILGLDGGDGDEDTGAIHVSHLSSSSFPWHTCFA
jgi:hypothetical protein